MKLQIMSDLHLEMHADRGAEFIRNLDPTGVDVLVLAGDITMARHYEDLENVFKLLARKYRHILYVPGNHEYYKSSPKQVGRNLARLVKDIPEVVMTEGLTWDWQSYPEYLNAIEQRPHDSVSVGHVVHGGQQAQLGRAQPGALREHLFPGQDAVRAAADLLGRGPACVLVTDGAAPVRAFTTGREMQADVPAAPVVDTVGAGDSFGGAFLAWWNGNGLGRSDLGDPDMIRQATQAAIDASVVTCTRRGAEPPWAYELAGHDGWRWLPPG